MKLPIRTLAIAATIAVLAGCAAPKIQGDSAAVSKNVTYPKEGQQIHVVPGGLVHMRADYMSRYAFRLTEPFTVGFKLGRIVATTEDVFLEANLEGKLVYCSQRYIWQDLLTIPQRRACFVSNQKGKFNQVMAAPGGFWLTNDLEPSIDYVSKEISIVLNSKILKRELVFEGSQNGNLYFTEKLYEISLDSPSRAKPLLAKVDSIPAQISLNGVILNVVAYTANSLTFTLQKAWQ
jgi:hypothetical protein